MKSNWSPVFTGGVPAGARKTSLFVTVHIPEPIFHRLKSELKKRQPSGYAAAGLPRMCHIVTVPITGCRPCRNRVHSGRFPGV